ncbi:MAG: SCO family protein [Gammaproteobacteria bacterium]
MNKTSSFLSRTCESVLVCAGVLALLSMAGCGRSPASQPWNLLNITGHMPPLQFTLMRDDGQTVTQKDYLGKPVILYFGYTHCPDVCPTTLADLATALRQLGPVADQVRVLFVSVDPARDTPAVLKSYTNAFGPWFVGLTGSQQELTAITKRYRVAYRLGKPDAKGNYAVYHSSAVFIFDRQGNARLLTSLSDKPDLIATDLKRLLSK